MIVRLFHEENKIKYDWYKRFQKLLIRFTIGSMEEILEEIFYLV